MADGQLRRVTRAYVWGLIIASAITAIALLTACWGIIALSSDTLPVTTENIPYGVAIFIVVIALAAFIWSLWLQALELLRGKKTPAWSHIVITGVAGYFIWSLIGVLAGFTLEETFKSPFAISLGIIWGLCSIMFWALLARRVYTQRAVPQWPWERRGEPGPDWIGEDPWNTDSQSDDGDAQ